MTATIPDPALVVLVGAAGSGKSSWAAQRYRDAEIVSADRLRGIVGSGPADLEASADAFGVLDTIVSARCRRKLTTVVDTLGLDPERRRGYLALARSHGLAAVIVLVLTDAATCRARNSARDRPVPAPVLGAQLRRMRGMVDETSNEGWDLVVRAHPGPVESASGLPGRGVGAAGVGPAGHVDRSDSAPRLPSVPPVEPEMSFVLQISAFPWREDPAGWLRSITTAAVEAGFQGLALMDHLIQIPQVGRAWDPIPEPFVTLGFLAGIAGRLRLGTLVTPVTFRSPGIVAKSVATLDALTGGRAFCGIGAGWWEREHQAFGLEFPPAAARLTAMESAIVTMRALWAPGTKAFQGDEVRLPETTCYPRPVGTVPIIVGGGGERRTLRIAARLGDGCNLSSDLATLDRKLAVLHEHCAAVGRDPDELNVTVLDVPVIGTNRDHVAGLVERLRGRTAATAFARRHHAGTLAQQLVRYRALAERKVHTVFLSLPDLVGPDEVLRCAPLTAAFR